MSIKAEFQKFIQRSAGEYQNIQTVRLGKLDGHTVLSSTDGVLWARQWNGKEIEVYNRALVPADFDLRVLVGTYRTQPNKWFILQAMEDYLTPAGGGRVGYHHSQHEFGGADVVWINRKQVLTLTVLAAGGWDVQVYGGIVRTGDTYVEVENQSLDLSSAVITAGAAFVNIEADEDGVLHIDNVGTVFGAAFLAQASYIPIPADGRFVLATVLMYESQSEITDSNILVPWPADKGGVGAQIYSAAEDDNIQDADQVGYYQTAAARLRSITWSSIKAKLKTYFDTLYAALSHTHAAGDVSIADAGAYYTGSSVEAALQEIGAGGIGGGGGGGSMSYDDISDQTDGSTTAFILGAAPVGEVLLFYNTTLQSIDTFSVASTTLTTTFTPEDGSKLIAIYGISGTLVEPRTSPALRVYKNQNFR